MPDISVIIAAWNAADCVGHSVSSAMQQAGADVETIVIDDASPDDSLVGLQSAPGLVLDRLAVNGGPAAARNRGLELARGDWVAVLDSDDTMGPQRLRRMCDLAISHSADVVLGNFQRVTPDGRQFEQAPFLSGPAYASVATWDLAFYLSGNQVSHRSRSLGYLKPLFRGDFLREHGLCYDETLRNGEDCHLIFACLAAGARVLFDPVPDYFYTVRPGSVSHKLDPGHIDRLIAADDAFVERHAAGLTDGEKALFATRRQRLADLVGTERVMHALRQRQIGSAALGLMQRPRLAPRLARQLGESLRKRVDARAGRGLAT